jgi:predicted nucleic acid-binding protein
MSNYYVMAVTDTRRPDAAAGAALDTLLAMRFAVLTPNRQTHRRVLEWPALLSQSKAYDVQYLAAAEGARAELWTADRRLAHAAAKAGATWVHSIGDGE